MNASTLIAIIILVIILIPAVRATVKHMKGEGSCCGGPKEKRPAKKITGTVKKKLTVKIDGMQCVNCRNRVEKALDGLDGVVAKVDLETKTASVSLYQDVDPELIKSTIENLDFKVISIT